MRPLTDEVTVVTLPRRDCPRSLVPLVTHGVMVAGHIVGAVTTSQCPATHPWRHRNPPPATYIGCMPQVDWAWRGATHAGLALWEHLVVAQLRWIEQRGGIELLVLLSGPEVRANAARLWQTGGTSMQPQAIRELGLPADRHAVRLSTERAQACLAAKSMAASLLRRIRATSIGPSIGQALDL